MKKLFIIIGIFIFCSNIVFAKESVSYKDGIYHIIIPNKDIGRIEFILSPELVINSSIHKQQRATLTINTGFFDPQNQKTISYIYNHGILEESPLDNENLINNKVIKDNWDKIFNRTEFRILKNKNGLYAEIAPHNSLIKDELVTSAQGGPMLLPTMDLEKEFFIVKNSDGKIIRESASVLHKTARTLIGIKSKNIHIFIVTNKSPMTIFEARDLCKKYNLESAMAFDGGSSTSLNYKNIINIVSTGIKTDDTGRKLKSFMIFK